MTLYATTTDCLRAFILRYFGEAAPDACGNCSCCLSPVPPLDVTDTAKLIAECVGETGQRFGVGTIEALLSGKPNETIKSFGLEKSRFFGAASALPKGLLAAVANHMLTRGWLEVTSGKPIAHLPTGGQPLPDKMYIRLPPPKTKAKKPAVKDVGLFADLKALRLRLAREHGLAPYMIFGDKTLLEMCERLPASRGELLEVSGVGEVKLAKYGDLFLEAIAARANNAQVSD